MDQRPFGSAVFVLLRKIAMSSWHSAIAKALVAPEDGSLDSLDG